MHKTETSKPKVGLPCWSLESSREIFRYVIVINTELGVTCVFHHLWAYFCQHRLSSVNRKQWSSNSGKRVLLVRGVHVLEFRLLNWIIIHNNKWFFLRMVWTLKFSLYFSLEMFSGLNVQNVNNPSTLLRRCRLDYIFRYRHGAD